MTAGLACSAASPFLSRRRREGARGRGEARAPLQSAVCGSCETSRELFDCRRRRCLSWHFTAIVFVQFMLCNIALDYEG